MWDAFDGKLRCSYRYNLFLYSYLKFILQSHCNLIKIYLNIRGINDLDELDTAISIAFSYDGSNIFAGYKKSFRIFDTAR